MQHFLKSFVTISALSSLVVAPMFLSAAQASAEEKGTDASYVGAGISAGVTNGGSKTGGDAATFGGNVTGRLKLDNTPLSVRTHVLWSNETATVVPQVSVDAGIAKNTNAYVGAGYSFVEDQGKPTPLGNKNGVAVTAGVESEVSKNFMVYSNATLGVNTYKNSPASALSINSGVGLRFR